MTPRQRPGRAKRPKGLQTMLSGNGHPEYMRLLDALALARVHRLELAARGAVEGFVTGRHRSPSKGFSTEFAEHRQYVPGDDAADIDWRVYGRSDRYYVKQYVEETNLRATILVDCSGSMSYTGSAAARRDGKALSKFEYAQYLAASLAHLMLHQQDAVGLVTFDSRVRRYIPARNRGGHMRVILQELAGARCGAETRLAAVFHDIAERVHRRGLVAIISDLLDDPEAVLAALHHFRYRRHEVIVMHVMAEEELTLPFDGFCDFRDLEAGGRRVRLDPRAARAEYLNQLGRHVERLKTGCGRMSIDYVLFSTRHSFDEALARFLAERMARVK